MTFFQFFWYLFVFLSFVYYSDWCQSCSADHDKELEVFRLSIERAVDHLYESKFIPVTQRSVIVYSLLLLEECRATRDQYIQTYYWLNIWKWNKKYRSIIWVCHITLVTLFTKSINVLNCLKFFLFLDTVWFPHNFRFWYWRWSWCKPSTVLGKYWGKEFWRAGKKIMFSVNQMKFNLFEFLVFCGITLYLF